VTETLRLVVISENVPPQIRSETPFLGGMVVDTSKWTSFLHRKAVMHELFIAQNIREIVLQSVPDGQCRLVRTVSIKVGELSGVIAESLDFCFSAITKDTPLEGTLLRIEHVPFGLRCRACNRTFSNNEGTVLCPRCGGNDTVVISGTELQVVAIELEDEEPVQTS